MKKYLITLIVLIYITSAFGQNSNPYEIFGHTSLVKYEMPVSEMLYIKNKDTNSSYKVMALDIENNKVILLGINNSIIQTLPIKANQLLRWLSTDPLAKKYPSASPYNFALNNPIYLKDLDGRDVYIFDQNLNVVACFRTDYKDVAMKLNYTSSEAIKSPVIQKTNDIWYSGHKSYQDAFAIGISGGQSKGILSANAGLEVVLFTRGPDAGTPMLYSNYGGGIGKSIGSNVNFSLSAMNLYKPYGMIDDMLDKRTPADDANVTAGSYEGPFYVTQLGIHNTIYGTNNGYPSPAGKINWFGEGVTPTSIGVSANISKYSLLGPLNASGQGSTIPIDDNVQKKIDAFNLEHPKETPAPAPAPATVSPATR